MKNRSIRECDRYRKFQSDLGVYVCGSTSSLGQQGCLSDKSTSVPRFRFMAFLWVGFVDGTFFL